nr:peptidase domain-containing protein [uncultured Methanolobus sp.]
MKRIAIAFLVFLLCVSVAGAKSSETAIDAVSSGSNGGISIMSLSNYITQGETNWHSTYVGTYTDTLTVDLNWGDTSDSLKLYVYSPSNELFGPYYDNSDGRKNGRIRVNIYNGNGIEQGTWMYRVYGYSVIGTEDYSI